MSRLSADERRRGVLTFSSGNHAQAIALAGRVLDIPRVIVMPTDAPAVKREATEAYGGEVILYDRDREDREAIGRRRGGRARPHRDPALRSRQRHRRSGHGGTRALRRSRTARFSVRSLRRRRTAVGQRDLGARAGSGLPRHRRRAGGGRRCDAIVSDEGAADGSQSSNRRRRRPYAFAGNADVSARPAVRERHDHRGRSDAAAGHVSVCGNG